ncbi:hypothetical protein R2F25_17210 [Streptomyces sp. UP1A-1]|nr:hypothetical protein [Streptomyces sp. UP1A-1]
MQEPGADAGAAGRQPGGGVPVDVQCRALVLLGSVDVRPGRTVGDDGRAQFGERLIDRVSVGEVQFLTGERRSRVGGEQGGQLASQPAARLR